MYKIVITIEGESGAGIGKTTVAAVVKEALERYHYEVLFKAESSSVTPGASATMLKYERDYVEECKKHLSSELSKPRSVIQLIEKI